MKRTFIVLMVVLLSGLSAMAQEPGRLLHSEVYHEIDRFEFFGQASVSERNLRIDIHENEIIPYNLNGDRCSREKILFHEIDCDGNRVYQMNDAGQITSFTVIKDWDITANRRYSYSKGIALSSQTTGEGQRQL